MSDMRVPSFPLKAIGHGRVVDLARLGVPAVLLFVGRETSDQAAPLSREIRERYPLAAQVVICNIADVRGIPRLVRKPVEMLMKSSYKDAVEGLELGRTPEEYVLILPDWDGVVYEAAGVTDVSKDLGAAVVDAEGRIIGVHQGPGAAQRVVELLEPQMARPTA
jgi:hypothetical protein